MLSKNDNMFEFDHQSGKSISILKTIYIELNKTGIGLYGGDNLKRFVAGIPTIEKNPLS